MKVFIAGARAIRSLDELATRRLKTICDRQYDILVGDCYGVDSAVQRFCVNLSYNRVTIFASNGKARNNLGGWNIENIPVAREITAFDFYRQKDIAMAQSADCGFMIWDGKSKGTYQNIVTLLEMGKHVLVYIVPKREMQWLKSADELKPAASYKQTVTVANQLSLY